MNYDLVKDSITLVEEFENALKAGARYTSDIEGLKLWIADKANKKKDIQNLEWEGKALGRSPESVISTLLVHMSRYAKLYSKAAMQDSDFSTQEEFIYLIILKSFGPMSKMDLIKKNIQEKPAGMKVIDRLIKQDWISQQDSDSDKRSKVLSVTKTGLDHLDRHMKKIRRASQIVAGNLSEKEKLELIYLLSKLSDFHYPIYTQNYGPEELLDKVNLK